MNVAGSKICLMMIASMMMPLVSGCLPSGSDTPADVSTPIQPPPSGSENHAPTISGDPAASVIAGESYAYSPDASDSDGDDLTYSVTNLPSWASFDNATGTLSGSPDASNVGTYASIRISVSDGDLIASTPAFSIEVTQNGNASVTLNWSPPTENSDGTPLTNLAGYRIYYGVAEGSYTNQISINNAGITSYVVENLTPSRYYFVATAVNSQGVESDYSNVTMKDAT